MKTNLDALMEENQIEAILVTGPATHNPPMIYLMGSRGHVSQADLIRRRNHSGTLFHFSMERDEAAKSGLETCSYSKYPFSDLLKEANGDKFQAVVLRYKKMLEDSRVTSGKVLLYGQTDLGRGYAIFSALQQVMPEIEFVGYQDEDIILTAMATKDESEIERIRNMGEITTRVVGNTADFLSTRPVRSGKLLNAEGEYLTISEVKSRINFWLAEAGAENPEGTIFAIGHDSAVPHSSGNPTDMLRLGETIVFDIFPCEEGGGYYYDLTRTWCLGYATDETQALYDDVYKVYNTIVAELKVNVPYKHYQQRTCEIFGAMGHPTVLNEPETEVGYVHSVGHGVGLNIHERPFSGLTSSDADRLAPGSVFTIEPGLYYPQRNMGVRLEDTHRVYQDGNFEKLVDYPLDLVIPVSKH